MAGITRFEEIEAWKTARQLTNTAYELSNQAGFNRDFGLRDQIRRASISVMSNIAEGFESRTDTQFINFLGMAKASAGEARAQLYVALDQKYIAEEQFKDAYSMAETCARQIAKFIAYLESNPRKHRISDDEADYEVRPSTDL
ncbi:MAG: four helix bundle protein [Chloroflexota bacterium]|nr:four helix bundle protein [Chloroflexota bacterium]MBI5705164.1 four helix bundle protein [Chloroflexota bacterium]